MLTSLSLDSLGELDSGAARAIIDAEIRRAVQDVDDRGEDEKPRQVVITLSLEKLDNGMIAAHVEAMCKLPKRRTAGTVGMVKTAQGQPAMVFQTLSPDDPHQSTIDTLEKS